MADVGCMPLDATEPEPHLLSIGMWPSNMNHRRGSTVLSKASREQRWHICKSRSLGGQWLSPHGRDLSWMSKGLDPVAGLSAGSCLITRASVSLGSLTRYATKCKGKGGTSQNKSLTLIRFPQKMWVCALCLCVCAAELTVCEISKG